LQFTTPGQYACYDGSHYGWATWFFWLLGTSESELGIYCFKSKVSSIIQWWIQFQTQYKYPNITCEVLTSEIGFVEKIVADPIYLEKLFHFFTDTAPPLNPLLASYVCRVLSEMVIRKPDQVRTDSDNFYYLYLPIFRYISLDFFVSLSELVFIQAEYNSVSGILNWNRD